ncbi:MAG: type II toxin-antitoxin system ParD family antitoxin [Rhodospirillales bacterium]|nr:type II toxin-antitoxin system ParD family antitoxin [Rhodospirillales bacterium]
MTAKPKFKSDVSTALHTSAAMLHKVGALDEATMHHFDARHLAGPASNAPTVANLATNPPPCHPARMANVEKLSVALTPDMVAEMRAAVEDGDYGSVSEVVRDALRDWRLRRKVETLKVEELRRLVQEGIDSGPGLEAEAVFARLRARFGAPPAR